MMKKYTAGPLHWESGAGLALLAAALYGISAPVAKVLLETLSPTFMAALLYLGAGLGMLAVVAIRRLRKEPVTEAAITKGEFPWVAAMILLDIAAPVFLMLGLTLSTAASASLLNNFEIVATSLIALLVFREAVGRRMWVAILLITIASGLLSLSVVLPTGSGIGAENVINPLTGEGRFAGEVAASTILGIFSKGSLFVLLACICWGLENNCTRMLSLKDPAQIVVVKGIGSGLGALLLTLWLGTWFAAGAIGPLEPAGILAWSSPPGGPSVLLPVALPAGLIPAIAGALLLGFVAYGLSILFYIRAQRHLGAARTSAYYAAAPFIGVVVSWIFLGEGVNTIFLGALAIMIWGTWFAVTEDHSHHHIHETIRHNHRHSHKDGHHDHDHDLAEDHARGTHSHPEVAHCLSEDSEEEHCHDHEHLPLAHTHPHLPDLHHRHTHEK